MNADGWGVGLHMPGQGAPTRWRSTRPLWNDASFASVAPVLHAPSMLAAVRSATAGMPIEETATAPFSDGTWLLSHNGRVDRAVLPMTSRAESTCDSALLAAHVFEAGAEQVGATIAGVAARDPEGFLTVLLAAPERLLGVTWGDTLSYLVAPDGVAVASEPWDDDPRWIDIPDHHLIDVTSRGVTLTDLDAQ